MVDIITAAMGAKMASAQVQSQIDTALSSVYKYKGQCTNSELANKTKTAGDVWEITDTGTYAAGTDVVCDGTNWGAMTGHLHVNVVDSLDSTSATDALSANMGKALADGKQNVLTAGEGIEFNNDVINVKDYRFLDDINKLTADGYITGSTNNYTVQKTFIIYLYCSTGSWHNDRKGTFFIVPKGTHIDNANAFRIYNPYIGDTSDRIPIFTQMRFHSPSLNSIDFFNWYYPITRETVTIDGVDYTLDHIGSYAYDTITKTFVTQMDKNSTGAATNYQFFMCILVKD